MRGIYLVSQLKAQPAMVGKARQRELQQLGTFTHSQKTNERLLALSLLLHFLLSRIPCPRSSPTHNRDGPFHINYTPKITSHRGA